MVLVSEESLFACDPCVQVICFCHVTCGYLCLPCSGQGFASCDKQPVLSISAGHGRQARSLVGQGHNLSRDLLRCLLRDRLRRRSLDLDRERAMCHSSSLRPSGHCDIKDYC